MTNEYLLFALGGSKFSLNDGQIQFKIAANYKKLRISEKLKLNSIAYDFTTKNTKITKEIQDLSHAASCSS